jgi:putative endonuclease
MALEGDQVILRMLDALRHRARRKVMAVDLATGRRGEDLAHRFLRDKGYQIVARNYRLASGRAEADLIARDGEDLVIVEVKTRETDAYGPPDRAVGTEKLRHMSWVAKDYAARTRTPPANLRMDVVTVVLTQPPRIELLRAVGTFSR